MGGANALPYFSSSSRPGGPLPSASPVLSLASLLRPQDQSGLEGASKGIGPGLRAGQTFPADWAGELLVTLPPDLSPQWSLQAWEHLPPLNHPSGVTVLSGLHFSSTSVPPHPTSSLGGSSHSLGVKVSHQCLAGALVVGRRKLCIFSHHHLDSTPLSISIFQYSLSGSTSLPKLELWTQSLHHSYGLYYFSAVFCQCF